MDAQYTGVAQRRRRVFVVASARTDFDPIAVLFEFDGLRRDIAPSREAGQETASTLAGGARRSGGYSYDDIPTVGPLMAAHGPNGHGGSGIATQQGVEAGHVIACVTGDVAHTLKAEGFDASEDGTGRGQPIVNVIGFGGNNTSGPIDVAAALNANRDCHNPGDFEAGTLLAVLPFDTTQITSATNRCQPAYGDPCHPLAAGAHPPAIAFQGQGTNVGVCDDGVFGTLRTLSHSPASGAPCIAFPAGMSGTQAAATEDLSPALGALNQTAVVGGSMRVRRLTPRECERLQAFPDDYTLIPTWNGWRKMDDSETPDSCRAEGLEVRCSHRTGRWSVRDVDGPRYKAIGNSWAVTNVRWIGERIDRAVRAAAAQGVM